jgi:uncharacterized protein (UPF0254 family)
MAVAAAAGAAAGAVAVTATGVWVAVGAATAAWVAAAVFLLSTALAFTVALVPAVVVPTVVVLSACLDVWHPTSIVAATNMTGIMLRMIWRFTLNAAYQLSPSTAHEIKLANRGQVFSTACPSRGALLICAVQTGFAGSCRIPAAAIRFILLERKTSGLPHGFDRRKNRLPVGAVMVTLFVPLALLIMPP